MRLSAIMQLTLEQCLGEPLFTPGSEPLILGEPASRAVIVGRFQTIEREVRLDQAAHWNVPVLRRRTGGGTVVLGPGQIVIGLRMRALDGGPKVITQTALAPVIRAITHHLGQTPILCGEGDLTLDGRKILGSSLKISGGQAWYLAVLLVEDASIWMERLLNHPSREPQYRAQRKHSDFCTCLSAHGGTISVLLPILKDMITQDLAEVLI